MKEKHYLTNIILLALEKAIDGAIKLNDFTYNPEKYLYGYPRVLKKSYLSKSIKRLRERGLVSFLSEEEIVLRLTSKGKEKVLWTKMKNENSKWDGIWRLVIFDVPEKKRAARDLLRSLLKQWGFIRWQNSVWASKKDCAKLIKRFIKKVGISQWVMVIESNNVG
ncbi:CRISPR-associated endonuclease Cas2 [Candidatus Daviesbacteria bacterium]|nr:CRISPR-associated endonuclease Cas2 [Candidatus Daviesbacteria bacterium]